MQIESALNGIGEDDSSGTTAVEYALMVSAIAGLVAGARYFLGAKANNLYNNVTKGRWRRRSAGRVAVGGSATRGLLLPPGLIGAK